MFKFDVDPTNRCLALDTLITNHKDEVLHELLRVRLLRDDNYYVRFSIARVLLDSYGTPSDFDFIAEYAEKEVNAEVKEYILDALKKDN